jgi:hypothetical protein
MRQPRRFGAVAAIAGVVIAVVAAVILSRDESPPPAPPPPKFPARDPPPHPVLPSEASEKPPEPFCEGHDIFSVGGFIRAAQKQAAAAAKQGLAAGAPRSCHDEASDKELSAALSKLIARTRACVARDRELDSQWNLLESAVTALDRCGECTHPRPDRLTGCARVLELVAAAEKATPPDK